jgi:hypothetical protein
MPKKTSEVYCMIDGKRTDASIHDAWMEGVEENEEYRMTSYNVAVDNGISKDVASRLYLQKGDKKYVDND